jgi:hypothetical protein
MGRRGQRVEREEKKRMGASFFLLENDFFDKRVVVALVIVRGTDGDDVTFVSLWCFRV